MTLRATAHSVLTVLAAFAASGCVSIGNNVNKAPGSSPSAKAAAPSASAAPISEQQVNAAQQAWCDGLVRVAQVHARGGDARAEASKMIDDLYDYADGTVFFKPTLAFGPRTFRPTREGALAYFVGGDAAFPEDTGFALKGWTAARYDNNAAENGIQIHGDVAITMGNVYITGPDGKEVMVDKTFVFRRCADGNLRLCVHKSALPFSPN
ncbi:MAG: hypothetical protein RL005_1752 [Planctomycetota bacterium]|jgi:hypothetical protein